jgi:probable HAF family extracellular repeat protein
VPAWLPTELKSVGIVSLSIKLDYSKIRRFPQIFLERRERMKRLSVRSVLMYSTIVLISFVCPSSAIARFYKITDLGTIEYTYSRADDINDLGQVVGYSRVANNNPLLPFLWTPEDGMVILGPLPVDHRGSGLMSINNLGKVAGNMYHDHGPPRAYIWSEEGGFIDLGDSNAYDVNDQGVVVGESHHSARFRPVLWNEEHELMVLETLGYGGGARAINENGQVAGWNHYYGEGSFATLWTPEGDVLDIGAGEFSRAEDINNNGEVVGYYSPPSPGKPNPHAFLWRSESEGILDLGVLSGYRWSWAYAINNMSEVVGRSYIQYPGMGNTQQHAFLWSEELGMLDLNGLIPMNSGWDLWLARGINNQGQIAGFGGIDLDGDRFTDETHAFLLTPVSVIGVQIDALPATEENRINLKWKKPIPVAVHTTEEFDVYDIDPVTCLFAGAEPESWTIEDVDNDGDDDILFRFWTQQLNLIEGSTEGTFYGELADGTPVLGKDYITVEGPDSLRISYQSMSASFQAAAVVYDELGEGHGDQLDKVNLHLNDSIDVTLNGNYGGATTQLEVKGELRNDEISLKCRTLSKATKESNYDRIIAPVRFSLGGSFEIQSEFDQSVRLNYVFSYFTNAIFSPSINCFPRIEYFLIEETEPPYDRLVRIVRIVNEPISGSVVLQTNTKYLLGLRFDRNVEDTKCLDFNRTSNHYANQTLKLIPIPEPRRVEE